MKLGFLLSPSKLCLSAIATCMLEFMGNECMIVTEVLVSLGVCPILRTVFID